MDGFGWNLEWKWYIFLRYNNIFLLNYLQPVIPTCRMHETRVTEHYRHLTGSQSGMSYLALQKIHNFSTVIFVKYKTKHGTCINKKDSPRIQTRYHQGTSTTGYNRANGHYVALLCFHVTSRRLENTWLENYKIKLSKRTNFVLYEYCSFSFNVNWLRDISTRIAGYIFHSLIRFHFVQNWNQGSVIETVVLSRQWRSSKQTTQ
jgi:hypothetical protein